MIHRWALRKIANCPKWCYRFCKERKAYILKKRREGIAFAAKGVFREVCGTSLSFHPNVTIPSLRISLFSKQCADFHMRDLWIWLCFHSVPLNLRADFLKSISALKLQEIEIPLESSWTFSGFVTATWAEHLKPWACLLLSIISPIQWDEAQPPTALVVSTITIMIKCSSHLVS